MVSSESLITYPLTMDILCKLQMSAIMAELTIDNYLKKTYNVNVRYKLQPSRIIIGILEFESEQDLTWFLLHL
jgi:hypothetical protein